MKRRFIPSAVKMPVLSSERKFWQKIDFAFIRRVIGPVIFLLITGILIVISQWAFLNREGESFKEGQPAPETYRVISHMRYDDQDSAQTLRDMVASSVVGVTVRDAAAKTRLHRRLEALRNANDPASRPHLTYIPEPLLNALADMNMTQRARIITMSYQAGSSYIDRIVSEKVYRNNTALTTSIMWQEINKLNLSPNEANLVYQILSGLGSLSIRIDEELTELARQAAVSDVPAIDRRLEPGDVIVSRGDIVTEQVAELLRLQGYTEDVFPFRQLAAVIICVLVLPLWLNILGDGAGDRKPADRHLRRGSTSGGCCVVSVHGGLYSFLHCVYFVGFWSLYRNRSGCLRFYIAVNSCYNSFYGRILYFETPRIAPSGLP